MATTLQIIFRGLKLRIYIYIHYMYISAPKRQKSWNPGNDEEKTSFWKMQVLERCFDGIFSVLPGLCIRGCAGPVRNSPMRIDQQQTGSISYRKMSLGQQKKVLSLFKHEQNGADLDGFSLCLNWRWFIWVNYNDLTVLPHWNHG